jgi:hypothetical protein
VFGSPDLVREQMAPMIETSGCNDVLCVFALRTLTHEQPTRSLRLFVDEVMPLLTPSRCRV